MKFRVYDMNGKCYVTNQAPWCITSDGKLNMIGSAFVHNNNFKVEYSTGIYDKNGNEIYENDIIEEGVVKQNGFRWYINDKDELLLRSMKYTVKGNANK